MRWSYVHYDTFKDELWFAGDCKQQIRKKTVLATWIDCIVTRLKSVERA